MNKCVFPTIVVADQLVSGFDLPEALTHTLDAAGNQQIEQALEATTIRTWNCENRIIAEVLPSGQRVTMAYNANFRRTRQED